ncbi:MAG: DUF5985 family protein [Burkholderiales bacterium]
MDKLTYALCAVTALICAGLLTRSYLHTRVRLLFWCAVCFYGITGNNLLLVLDRWVFPEVDLSYWRLGLSLAAVMTLVAALVLETSD